MTRWLKLGLRSARRVVVAVVGGTIVLLGLALLVLPGPAFVVLPVGLAILGIEFAWARRWLRRMKETAAAATSRIAGNGKPSDAAGRDGAESRRPADDPGATSTG